MGAIIHFEIDGWFARRDGDFTADNVMRVAEAAASCWSLGECGATVYVAYDTREGAREAAQIAASTIAAHGFKVMLSDRYAPTPALDLAVARDATSCGGLVVTGAHLPDDYLGIKLRAADGGMGSQDFIDAVERSIDPEPADEHAEFFEVDIVTPYLDNLVRLVDGEAIEGAGLEVVCDCMYGSARTYLPSVLASLGVTVNEIHGMDDDARQNLRPQAIEPWVDDCEQAVGECDAVAGLIADGDGNLMGAVDEDGTYISFDKVAALVLGHLVVNRGLSGRVVLGLSSSTVMRRVARCLGCKLVVRPLGFKYICEDVQKGGALLGSEGFGGICIPSHIPDRDAMLGCILLCELMAVSGETLKSLVRQLEQGVGETHYGRRDLRLPIEDVEMLRTILPGINPRMVAGMEPCAVSHMDGLRLEFYDESWLLLRPSRTEPLVRIYAEADTVVKKDMLINAGCDIARGKEG